MIHVLFALGPHSSLSEYHDRIGGIYVSRCLASHIQHQQWPGRNFLHLCALSFGRNIYRLAFVSRSQPSPANRQQSRPPPESEMLLLASLVSSLEAAVVWVVRESVAA